MQKVLLSIITVSRYDDRDLDNTIQSVDQVFNKHLADGVIEHIVVCAEKINTVNNISNRKFIISPPRGVYPAMNEGLKGSVGEWVWFLNAKDTVYKNNASELIKKLTESIGRADLLMFGVNVITSDSSRDVYGRFTSPHQGTIYSTEKLKSINGFLENYRIISDRIAFDTFREKSLKISRFYILIANFFEDGISSGESGRSLKIKETRDYFYNNPYSFLNFMRFVKSFV